MENVFLNVQADSTDSLLLLLNQSANHVTKDAADAMVLSTVKNVIKDSLTKKEFAFLIALLDGLLTAEIDVFNAGANLAKNVMSTTQEFVLYANQVSTLKEINVLKSADPVTE